MNSSVHTNPHSCCRVSLRECTTVWTEQLILCKQDIAKLLTFTKAPKIDAVTLVPEKKYLIFEI